MKAQHWKISLLEACSNTLIGLGISLVVWFAIRYSGYYDINTSIIEGLEITALFTIISILRGFALRRFYVWQHETLEKWV